MNAPLKLSQGQFDVSNGIYVLLKNLNIYKYGFLEECLLEICHSLFNLG